MSPFKSALATALHAAQTFETAMLLASQLANEEEAEISAQAFQQLRLVFQRLQGAVPGATDLFFREVDDGVAADEADDVPDRDGHQPG